MCQVEGERATWHLVQLTGRRGEAAGGEKRRRRKEKGDEEEEVGTLRQQTVSGDGLGFSMSVILTKSEDEPGCAVKD